MTDKKGKKSLNNSNSGYSATIKNLNASELVWDKTTMEHGKTRTHAHTAANLFKRTWRSLLGIGRDSPGTKRQKVQKHWGANKHRRTEGPGYMTKGRPTTRQVDQNIAWRHKIYSSRLSKRNSKTLIHQHTQKRNAKLYHIPKSLSHQHTQKRITIIVSINGTNSTNSVKLVHISNTSQRKTETNTSNFSKLYDITILTNIRQKYK